MKKTAQHTQGPWTVLPEEVDKDYIRIRGIRLGGRYKIANVIWPVYQGTNEREAQETRVNARLIAAAPELLQALEMMLDRFRDTEGYRGQWEDEATDFANKVINKVKGE